MSHRIAIFILATAAALIAGPASADRECFEGSCLTSGATARPASMAAADVNATSAIGARFTHARHRHAHHLANVMGQYPVAAENLFVGVPGTIYPDGNVVSRYPYLQDDPSWQLCQIDRVDRRHRNYECGPYSYHPFGVYGYRPNGTYVPSRSAPHYVLAPSAKIIRIEHED
jgi:hypothetical protein